MKCDVCSSDLLENLLLSFHCLISSLKHMRFVHDDEEKWRVCPLFHCMSSFSFHHFRTFHCRICIVSLLTRVTNCIIGKMCLFISSARDKVFFISYSSLSSTLGKLINSLSVMTNHKWSYTSIHQVAIMVKPFSFNKISPVFVWNHKNTNLWRLRINFTQNTTTNHKEWRATY